MRENLLFTNRFVIESVPFVVIMEDYIMENVIIVIN